MTAKSRQQAVILAALVAVMLAVYARMARPAAPTSAPAAGPAPASGAGAGADAGPGVVRLDLPAVVPARQAQHDRASRLAWGRDPFTGGSTGAEVSGFDLAGILWDATQPIAMINGQMLRVGDELEGYRVTQISQDSVSLTDGSQTLTLAIPQ